MGQAVETAAVAECIRTTLDMFLHDHPALEHGDVEVDDVISAPDDAPPTFTVSVIGFSFEITVRGPADA